jgi:hypothetical protein
LQLDTLDLYLIHQPFGDVMAPGAMERYRRPDRAIGLSNFHPDRVMDMIVHHQVAPAVNQIETHPFHQQIEAQKFLQENGVQIESWGPFAEGRNNIFQNELLLSLAAKHQKTLHRSSLADQRGVVAFQSVRKNRCGNFNVRFRAQPKTWLPVIAVAQTASSTIGSNIVKMLVRQDEYLANQLWWICWGGSRSKALPRRRLRCYNAW